MAIADRLKATPLGVVAMAAGGGVFVAERFPIGPAPWLMVASIATAGWAWRRSDAASLLTTIAVVFAALHSVTMGDSAHHVVREMLLARPSRAVDVVVKGRVEKALRRDLPGAEAGAAWFHATEMEMPVLCRHVRGLTILKLLPGKTNAPPPGDYIIEGRLRLPRPADNPGQFDGEDYETHRGLAAELLASKMTCVREDRWNLVNALDIAAESCRQWIKNTLSKSLEDSPAERTVTLAMVIGGAEANATEDDLEKPFRETGTIHVFAVAGLHVGIVGYILWMFLRPLGLSRGALLAILIPALFGYAFVTGLRPSSLRAAVMAAVFFSSAIFNRRSSVLNSLGVAALIMLVFDTNQLFSVGFQMSFSVIAAIGICEPLIRRPFRTFVEQDPFLPLSLLTPTQHHWIGFKRWVVGLFTVSAAATVGSMPSIVGYFGLVTPVSVLANIVLVPVTFMVLFIAVLRLALALVHLDAMQALLGHSNWLFAKIALIGAKFFALLPGAAFYVEAPSLHLQPPARMTVLRMSGGGAVQHLRVGSSDWLLDCGGNKDFKFLLRPYLERQGVNEVRGLVMSHGDFEHIGATSPLVAEFPVKSIYESVLEPWPWSSSSATSRKLHTAGIKPSSLASGDTLAFGSNSRATVLHPWNGLSPRKADDRSLIMRIDQGAFRILWCNDAGFITEKTLLERYSPEELRSDVIIRNQNAGDFSMLAEFLNAVQPRCIISSNSTLPVEEKMPASLRKACADRKIRLFDQAQTGAVIMDFWPQRLDIKPFRPGVEKLTLTPSR
jgi:ComEC/Rec2-related protein